MKVDPLPPDAARKALERIHHVVILMMENRSFDHMVGYLSLSGGRADVDGLRANHANVYGGRRYPTFHLKRHAYAPWEDPDHSGAGVKKQIAGGTMNGFVESYVETRGESLRPKLIADEHVLVMGHYEAEDVPTYDHLAQSFLLCDRWFASVPGATWPNRLYAMCGESGGTADNKKLFGKFDWPLHNRPSFVRVLDGWKVNWRWYHAQPGDLEPPTLQVADARYLLPWWAKDHFALFDQREPITDQHSFLEDCENGALPSVSWIDPNFGVSKKGTTNDDHPPGDITQGQALVRRVCNAVMASPLWESTLLVVTYDEHGGFFDHVAPPPAPDDVPRMRESYGVRVPAFVVCPYVEPSSVSDRLFDHTSIIRTVLKRFCPAGHTIPHMGIRTDTANHLGAVLTAAAPRNPVPVPDHPMLQRAEQQPPSQQPALDEVLQLARPRPANVTIDESALFPPGPPPANDIQLGLIRAGIERKQALEGPNGEGPGGQKAGNGN
jgi:phospholipase C